MKITEIIVQELFDAFSHSIPLNTKERVTLMIGENGFGKTVILKMIKALFSKDFLYFHNIIFKSLQVKFDDNVIWELVNSNDFEECKLSLKLLKDNKFIEEKTVFQIITEDEQNYIKETSPNWYEERVNNLSVNLIETQRLLTVKGEQTVLKCSSELSEKIKLQFEKSEELAARLYRTYPSRLAERRKQSPNISQEELTQKLNQLEEKRSLLDSVGLIDKEKDTDFLYDDSADEFMKHVLLVYIDDNNRKLETFDEIANKIKLFIDIINKRFLYKKIHIDKEKGFVFTSTVTQKEIPLEKLSSGEQHELVLFYELLFKIPPDSLVLIDEPEISLHISWQNQFVKDLKDIIRLNKTDILIATHSPDIIGNNWDLSVELQGVEEN
ncbi:MAG: AAA family ATPase [Desulfobacteraceae bacterium]|nr:AAA family ATPase [Desulfobacteraceae bacterium]